MDKLIEHAACSANIRLSTPPITFVDMLSISNNNMPTNYHEQYVIVLLHISMLECLSISIAPMVEFCRIFIPKEVILEVRSFMLR